MSELIKTLHKKGDASIEIYPNIKRDNIPTHAINNDKLDINAVGTNNINDLAVTTAKLMAECVTTAKISDSAVTTAKLNDSSVTTAKINDSAITTAKLGNGAVTEGKIASNTITPAKLTFTLYNYGGTIETSNYYIPFEVITSENYIDINSMTLQQWLELIHNFRQDNVIYLNAYNLNTNNYEVIKLYVEDNGDDTYSININNTDVTSDTNINDFYKINLFTIS